jgi:hypothetical protein
MLTPTRARAIAAVAQAVIAFLLITQTDVSIPAVAKVVLGAVSVGLAAVDWGALINGQADAGK